MTPQQPARELHILVGGSREEIIAPHLHAEFGKPVIVLTGCGNQPGRAPRFRRAPPSPSCLLSFDA